MILYFADRHLNILGQATTHLPEGVRVIRDLKTEDVETGVAIFECRIPFDRKTRAKVEEWTEVGNYILRSSDNENEFYNITDSEIDTKKQEVYIYAEDDGLDLLNDIAEAYEADQPYPISSYIERFAAGAGWEIGINEVEGLTKKLSWDSEQTTSARLLSIAEGFNDCELSYSFEIDGLQITKKYINIYEKRGTDTGIQLRLNKEIDSIITTKSITNLATALRVTGGTVADSDKPITLLGHEYDDGDFYVEGSVLKSRKALEKWSRYLWRGDDSKQSGGHIVKSFSDATATSQVVLCEKAIEKLKAICDMEVNYDVDITKFPEVVKIGDRVNIVDDAGELYLSSRVLILETSVSDMTKKAVLGEHLIKKDGISEKVEALAAQFAINAQSVQKALEVANSAKENADAALEEVENATGAVQDAKDAADNANQAAQNAQSAAQTATQKAEEAKQAAVNAQEKAEEAATANSEAQAKAQEAVEKANTATETAGTAKSKAEAAVAEAAAAKADAAQAQLDIAAWESELETVKTTMSADYTRKTEFTETTASLQSQITQNAGQISSTIKSVQTIDETANNAQAQAQQAAQTASTAKQQADSASATAAAAQQAADTASQAAQAAQNEADTAKAAAATAKSVADKAEADLKAAEADLAIVAGRVDATAEEVAAAQAAVETAQTKADEAKANAATAQAAADKAKSDAVAAQTAANNAKTAADNAQAAADNAQAAANKAQQDVNALAIRVTTAETDIIQTKEQITLLATKEEVTTTLGGYYSREETDAQIDVKADEITSTVSSSYLTKDDYSQAQAELTEMFSEVSQTAESLDIKFTEKTTETDNEMSTKFNELYKMISITENGISIGGGSNAMLLTVDNDNGIIFSKGGVPFGWWDGENFHTGNIVVEVNERAQFGNFAFVPRSDGSLSFLKVNGSASDAHTHSYKETVIQAATCEVAGTKVILCTGCGESTNESIPALGHNYTSVVTPPTETAQGYTTYTCTRCGDSYIGNYTAPTGSTTPGATLTVNASPTNAGTVSPSGNINCSYGEEVVITATANSDYRFSHWLVNGEDPGLPTGYSTLSVIMYDESQTVTAVFVSDESGGGSDETVTFKVSASGQTSNDYIQIKSPTGSALGTQIELTDGESCTIYADTISSRQITQVELIVDGVSQFTVPASDLYSADWLTSNYRVLTIPVSFDTNYKGQTREYKVYFA